MPLQTGNHEIDRAVSDALVQHNMNPDTIRLVILGLDKIFHPQWQAPLEAFWGNGNLPAVVDMDAPISDIDSVWTNIGLCSKHTVPGPIQVKVAGASPYSQHTLDQFWVSATKCIQQGLTHPIFVTGRLLLPWDLINSSPAVQRLSGAIVAVQLTHDLGVHRVAVHSYVLTIGQLSQHVMVRSAGTRAATAQIFTQSMYGNLPQPIPPSALIPPAYQFGAPATQMPQIYCRSVSVSNLGKAIRVNYPSCEPTPSPRTTKICDMGCCVPDDNDAHSPLCSVWKHRKRG
jgi:hypothetical protein